MKLYSYESMEEKKQSPIIDKSLQDFDAICQTLDLLSLTEEKLDNDFVNAYTSIDMLSLIGDKVTQIESKLINEPVASKDYLTIYSLNENFIKAIGKNLGCQKSVVSLEDYHVSIDKNKIHEVTMEGLKDILLTIWEKIKVFFKSLYNKIMLFVKRVIAAEPQLGELEKHIENNINKIKSKNLMLIEKDQKVNTNIAKYLAPYELNDFNEEDIWTTGVPKINRFISVINNLIKYSKTNNEVQITNKIKEHIDKSISDSKNLLQSIKELYSTNFKNKKIEDIGAIIENSNVVSDLNKITFEAINLITTVIEQINGEFKTDELLSTMLNLNYKVQKNENPYQEVVDAIEALNNKIKVDNNDIIVSFLYNCKRSTYTTPNIINLNIYSIVANGVPQSDIMYYSNNKNSGNETSTIGLKPIKHKYSDYGVVKYPTTNYDDNLFYAISDINGIEQLFSKYKEIKELPIEDVYKSMKLLETKIEDMTEAFDNLIEIINEIVDTLGKIIGSIVAYYTKEKNISKLNNNDMNEINDIIRDLMENKVTNSLSIAKMKLIKAMEYHKRNIANFTGKVVAELINIRASFLRDLGYYIYRSTEKYS
jgi:hypothetical protein